MRPAWLLNVGCLAHPCHPLSLLFGGKEVKCYTQYCCTVALNYSGMEKRPAHAAMMVDASDGKTRLADYKSEQPGSRASTSFI